MVSSIHVAIQKTSKNIKIGFTNNLPVDDFYSLSGKNQFVLL